MTCTVNGGWCGAAVLSICIPNGCLPIRHGGKVAFFNIISLTNTTTLGRVSHSPVLPVSVIRSSFFFALRCWRNLPHRPGVEHYMYLLPTVYHNPPSTLYHQHKTTSSTACWAATNQIQGSLAFSRQGVFGRRCHRIVGSTAHQEAVDMLSILRKARLKDKEMRILML